MTLANIVNLFDITQKESLISDKTKALIKKSMTVYDFKSRPFERVENHDVVKELEHAIKFRLTIKIQYKTERQDTKTLFNPYKIVFVNENFYLVGIKVSNQSVEFRRITMIKSVEFTKKQFLIDSEVESFLKTIQTPWATFGKEEIVVKLRVEVPIRRYFQRKKYLPSQKIVHTFENGDIEVHYTITNFREVEDLIIKWLPRIRVIAPRNLQKMLKRSLRQKLGAL